MVDAKQLLNDLKKLRKRLDEDLRRHHAASAARDAVQAEWQAAFDAKRTADTFETFWTASLDQAVVHWVLALVFLRFLEDNALIDRSLLSGPGERLELAQLRQREFFRARPQDSDAEYLLATFAEVARLPGLSGLYDPTHNPLFRLPISGDGAMALLEFFRTRVPETGLLVHDFTDPEWNTRFLGDLYQDLSDDARKRYALLQTPEFVEEWILDRTLAPAIREFGYERVTMIDPTCGSGHFLLGGFTRVLAQWERNAPDMPPAARAQKALNAVSGVDLNPFAVEIARFRLLLAALKAAQELRLVAAPDFRFSLAVGDSLLHGGHFGRQRDFGQDLDDGFQRRMRHHYETEDNDTINAILGRQYHAVVGNPPYITPKDPAMRDAYREIYTSCHMQYGLGAPFTERFFSLALPGRSDEAAGFVGLIVANSFMKREFGSKLIQEVLAKLDLTHIIDCSGAYIPGHGTPTVIMFGRNQSPVASVIRTVRGIRGEPGTPENPATGVVWSAIIAQTDMSESVSDFISSEDTSREILSRPPWNMGGGGAADVQHAIEEGHSHLEVLRPQIGFASFPGADDLFIAPFRVLRQSNVPEMFIRPIVLGDQVRDFVILPGECALVPYDSEQNLVGLEALQNGARLMWNCRTSLGGIVSFGGKTKSDLGDSWWGWYRWVSERYRTPLTITFSEVATHNHFVLERGGKVFKQTAPVIKLPAGASEDDYLGLLGLLNSSTACFWLKQVCHNKGATVDERGARQRTDPFEDFYQLNGTRVGQFPVAVNPPLDLARLLDNHAQRLTMRLPGVVCAAAMPVRAVLDAARTEAEDARARMIALQEELDWRCYHLYGLLEEPMEYANPPPLDLGERPFEIVLARRMAAGEVETAWFTRHRSTPIVELPAHWPEDYRALVELRIALIETDLNIGLIERPEYKRRWAMAPWEDMERDALRIWLLDRLERPALWSQGHPQIISTNQLADLARQDAEFCTVAELYAGSAAIDLEALVAGLATREAVPFLAPLRYSETGLRKRADWERTWEMQRAEDVIDAEVASSMAGALPVKIAAEQKRRKLAEVGAIPVPPKYRTPDFSSTDFWRLRGGLDVPKERFVSFPHCGRDADGSLPVLWAGYDHLARARAIAAWYVERKDIDGWPAPRLIPLLAGLLELVPWLKQWHNDIDQETGLRMGDYFAEFIDEEARGLGVTLAELRAWTPPAPVRRPRGRKAAV